MDIEIDKIDKMKVAELRALLSSHDLDTKGTKPVLVARLKEFMESKAEDAETEEQVEDEPEVVQEDTKEEAPEAKAEAPVVEEKDEPMEAEAPVEKKAEVTPVEKKAEATPVAADTKETEEKPMETEAAKPEAKAETKVEANKQQQRGQKRKRDDEPFVVTEDEPEIPDDYLCLDWSNSDLTLKINKENFVNAEPYHVAAWGFIFSSGRATHGFTSGKVAYQVKWAGNMEVKLEDVKEPHELRVGWSTDDSNLQAGESALSFAFSNFAKKAKDSTFEDFASSFTKDDVVTAMIDFSGANVSLSYAKNGESLGEAFSFPKSQLGGKALFPHISSRNVKFEANFGKNKDGTDKEPFFPLQDGFTMAGAQVASAQRGLARIGKRDECEMIMLIGLPGSGKTTWASKFAGEHPDKRYNVIGTTQLVERMKVNGEPRKNSMEKAKWDTLFSKLTKCGQDMLRIASQRRRNIIVDQQTNVFANAQKRKVRPFEGMQRKAIVIVPSEEDFKARTEAQEKAECKDVPDNAVMEMKANFALPEEGEESPFKEIIFTELPREEASKLVEEYNKDAKAKGFGKKPEMNQKRRRGNFMRNQMRGGRMHRGRHMGRGGPRGMFQQRGFPPRGGMMRGGPPMRGGPMGPPRGMPYGMPNRGGMGGPRGGMGGGPRGGMGGPRGGMGGNMRGGPRGGHQGGWQNQQKYGGGGGHGGAPAPWGGHGAPNPWQQQQQHPQQQQQQRPQQGYGGWGNMWNQGPGNNMGMGGGGQNMGQNPAWGGGNQRGNQGGYPGSQNWGGFR